MPGFREPEEVDLYRAGGLEKVPRPVGAGLLVEAALDDNCWDLQGAQVLCADFVDVLEGDDGAVVDLI